MEFNATSVFSGGNAPTLEVLVGGVVLTSFDMQLGTNSYRTFLEFSGSSPSSLSFRFAGSSGDLGDVVTFNSVTINRENLNIGSDLSLVAVTQGLSSSVSLPSAEAFGQTLPTLGTTTISGTGGDDSIVLGSTTADVIDALAGNDYITARGGDDEINGGEGDDYIFGEAGADTILGGAGNDVIFGNEDDDVLFGEADNDYLIGGDGSDFMSGGAGDDGLLGDGGDDIMFGGDGTDYISGDAGDDIMFGDDGNDFLYGGDDNDAISGGAGNDQIIGGAGNDLMSGGDDNDEIIGEGGDDEADGGAGDDTMYGGDGTDTFYGGDDDDYVSGGGDDDNLYGDAGDDTIIGGDGADTIDGDDGNDVIHGHGLDATTISNILYANPNVVYSQETGSFYQFVNANVNYATAIANAAASTISGVAGHLATITTAAENTFVAGLLSDNSFISGADTIQDGTWQWNAGPESGLQFSDISGNSVNNVYENWASGQPQTNTEFNAVLYASGVWHDWVDTSTHSYVIEWEGALFSDDNAIDTISGGEGSDWLYGWGGDDVLNGDNGNDFIFGGIGNDQLGGGGNDDVIFGGAGDDIINGGNNSDYLNGEDGDDTITGGSGGDTIIGGLGTDILDAGNGNDIIYAALTSATVGALTVTAAGGGGGTAIQRLVDASFTGGSTDGFTYQDDVFGGTAGVDASGSHQAGDGDNAAGSLEVLLGEVSGSNPTNISGGWVTTLDVNHDMTNVTIELAIRLLRDADFEGNEDTYVYVEVDNTRYGVNPNDYIFYHEDTGGGDYDSTWQNITLNIGSLSAGTHTLEIGQFLEGSTTATEISTLRIDDVVVEGEVTTLTLIDEGFDGGAGVFSYSDGLFGGGNFAYVDGAYQAADDVAGGGASGDSYADYVNALNPLVYYRLGDSGGTAVDETGTLNGTYLNSASNGVSGFNGSVSDTAASVDGSNNQIISIPDNAIFDTTAGTVTAWFNLDSISGTQVVFSKDGSGNTDGQFWAGVDNNGDIYGRVQQDGTDSFFTYDISAITGTSVQAGQWYMLSMAYGTGGADFYLNGTYLGTDGTLTRTDSNRDFILGARNWTGNPDLEMSGDLDEAAWFTTKMNATQVANLYNAGITASDNAASGSIEVLLGGVDENDVGSFSGGWSTTINPSEALENVTLEFDYRMLRTGQYENNEDTYIYVEVDGTRYGLSGNDYVATFETNGGDPDEDTGWVPVTLNIGSLSAGAHTIEIGGFGEGKTTTSELATLRLDDIYMEGDVVGAGGGNNATSSGNDITESHNIDGGDGNDIIYGSAGDDYLYGGAGTDTIYSDSIQEYTVADALAELAGVVYNEDTGSFYYYVSAATTAPTAFSNAAATTLNGVAGHIVHVTSAVENAFIDTLTGTATTWMGAQDTAVEGEWRWIGGVNDGDLFWLGNFTGSLQGSYTYENWNGAEPNDYVGGEDYVEIQNGGGWNDNGGPNNNALSRGYVIEWEASEVFSFGATILNGGEEADDLYGSQGADLFVFDFNADAFSDPDTVHNFDANDGDALDISDILSGLGVTSANVSNYVDISEANGLRVDITGSNSFGAGTTVASFSGITAVDDEVSMLANGNLIIY